MAFTKINAAGIGSTETVTLDGLSVINNGSFGGNLTVGGVLTYEDVTNVDSVGLITARNGIEIGARPGVGASISVDGNAIFSGITTATTLRSTTGIVTTLTATGLTVDSGTTNTCATFQSSDSGAVINLTDNSARSSIEQNGTDLKIISDTDAGDADSKIKFQVDSSTKVIIDSSGRLLLNATTEGNAGADDFTIGQVTGSTGITIRSGTTNNGNLYFSDGTSGDDEYRGSIQYQHANNSLHIATDAVERVIIDSSGRLLLGTTTEGHVSADDFTVAGSGDSGITIRSGSGSEGSIMFSDATSGTGEYQGWINYNHSSNFMRFFTNATERFRIYSNGAVLIGADSGEAGGDAKLAIDCEGLNIYDGVGDASNYGLIFANDPTGDKANGIGFFNDSASTCGGYIVHQDKGGGNIGDLVFGTSASSDTPVERVRITSGGQFLIGSSSHIAVAGHNSAFLLTGATYQQHTGAIIANENTARAAMLQFAKQRSGAVGGTTIVNDGDNIGQLRFVACDGTDLNYRVAEITAQVDGTPGSNDTPGRLVFSTTPDGSDNSVERMRITSAGCVNIGSTTNDTETDFLNILQPQAANHHSLHLTAQTSSSFSGSSVLKCVLHGFYRQSYGSNGFLFKNADDQSNNRGVRVHMYQNSASTVVGSIFYNSSSTDFNTSSDYRLKENEVLISDGITRIKQLKPYKFNFKNVPSETVDGFFAHEVASVVPHAVGGVKDEMKPNAWYQEGDTIPSGKAVGDVKGYSSTEMEIQQLDYSKLVTVTIAALQEAITKIETLEAKVAALEG